MSKKIVILVLIFTVVIPLTAWNISQFVFRKPTFSPELQGVLWPEPKPLQAFTLVDK